MTSSLSRKVTKTGAPAAGSTVEEGVVVEVATDEKIVDPNDPRAVQTPIEGLGGGNPLDVHAEPSPNEVFGGESIQVNPHTGEVVTGPDANPTEVSPTPANVVPAESVEDVQTADDLNAVVQTEAEAKDEAKAAKDEAKDEEPAPVEEPPVVEEPADEQPASE